MTFLRNLLTLLGVLAIVVVSVYIFRPDMFNSIIAKNLPQPQVIPTGQVYGLLSAQRGTLIEDVSAPTDALKFNYADLVVGDNVDIIPANNTPFLFVINKGKNETRYWQLNKNVRSVNLRDSKTSPFGVKFKQISSPNAPFQAVLWIDRETDLNLKFEVGTPK